MRIYDLEFDLEPYLLLLEQQQKRRKAGTCSYCGALDNGTCAYPSENKPGCFKAPPPSEDTNA